MEDLYDGLEKKWAEILCKSHCDILKESEKEMNNDGKEILNPGLIDTT